MDNADLLLKSAVTLSVVFITYLGLKERRKQLKGVTAECHQLTFAYFSRTDVQNAADLEHIAYLPSQSGISCVFRDTTIAIPASRCTEPPYGVARNLRALYAQAIQSANDRKK